jgi:hypothetical protein
MGKINKEWHVKNKMPAKASDDQRIVWHLEHTKNCACMPIPKGVIEIMKAKNIAVPDNVNGKK